MEAFKRRKENFCASVCLLAGLMIVEFTQSPRIESRGVTAAALSPNFDVASIRPDHLDGHHVRVSYQFDTLAASGVTLIRLIQIAYKAKEFQIFGGPSWANSETYAIQAKMDEGTVEKLKTLPRELEKEQRRQMMQSLLAERFKLKMIHSSTRVPIYALVLTKNGPKFSKSVVSLDAGENFSSKNGEADVKGISMSSFADWLSEEVGRKVVDNTGLEGMYDFAFHWTREKINFDAGGRHRWCPTD